MVRVENIAGGNDGAGGKLRKEENRPTARRKPAGRRDPQTRQSFRPLERLADALTYSNLWLSILSLASKKKVYAYSLPEEIDARFGFSPSRLMIYLVLYKLEGEGLLRSSEEGQRRYYALTATGRRCLQAGKRLLRQRADQI